MKRNLCRLYLLLVCFEIQKVQSQERCVVNRRLPNFAMQIQANQGNEKVQRSQQMTSREVGGVCHMQRLRYSFDEYYASFDNVNNAYVKTDDLNCSLQMCAVDENLMMCSVLEQNTSAPNTSIQRLLYTTSVEQNIKFQAWDEMRGLTQIRRQPCSSCETQHMADIHARFLSQNSTTAEIAHMSVGKPFRLSHARLLANDVHRARCGSNRTCSPVQNTLGISSPTSTAFMAALLSNVSMSTIDSFDTKQLWDRNWVWCPYRKNPLNRPLCQGSISRETWLNHTLRGSACANTISSFRTEHTAAVHFCLLNADTDKLCQQLVEWRARVRDILCEAGGQCATTDFFYNPTTYNLRDREFVSDTVRTFYTHTAGLQDNCKANEPSMSTVDTARLRTCAAVSVEPWVLVVERIRTARRTFVIIVYRYNQMAFELLHLIAVAAGEQVLTWAGDTSNMINYATYRLERATYRFVASIGNLFDFVQGAVTELFLSRGVGKQWLSVLQSLCHIVAFLWNNIWVQFLCPYTQAYYKFLANVVNAFSLIAEIPGFPGASQLKTINAGIQDIADIVTQDYLCSSKRFTCNVENRNTSESFNQTTLPTATRCWSTYLTFFGDNQQLSCSVADTCRQSRTDSTLVPCATCPDQVSSNVARFACDALTKRCTCAVPELTTTYCASNDECIQAADDASCRLIGNDLSLSKSAMPCASCQTQRVCLYLDDASTGVCACGARERNFQTCLAQDAAQQLTLTPILNNLCLFDFYLSTERAVASFAFSVTVPCQNIDPTSTRCLYVDDRREYMVSGRNMLRRRLLQDSSFSELTTYETQDPVCQDALMSDSLINTRRYCAYVAARSAETCKLINLDAPSCTFCSVSDFTHAVSKRPLLLVHLATSPALLLTVARRHGPVMQGVELMDTVVQAFVFLHDLLQHQNISDVLRIDNRNGSFFVLADPKIIPQQVAFALQHFVQTINPSTEDIDINSTNIPFHARNVSTRRLLLFRELVRSTEMTVRQGWDRASRLHQSYVTSLTQVLNYDYTNMVRSDTWWRQTTWPPYQYDVSEGEICNELEELLNISIRVANGTYQGWLTLTHSRSEISAVPNSLLRDSWPSLHVPPDPPPEEMYSIKTDSSSDLITNSTVWIVGSLMNLVGLNASLAYNVTYSLAQEFEQSFTCPYEAVQTCSQWRVTLFNATIIVSIWFGGLWLLTNALGVGFLALLALPLYTLAVMRLSYGYTWTCLPMLPVCGLEDFANAMKTLLPIRMSVPEALRDLQSPACRFQYEFNPTFRDYPSPDCVRSCRDPEFGYTSWRQVTAWLLAELGSGAVNWGQRNSKYLPWVDEVAFNADLLMRQNVISNSGIQFVRAHRVCAGLNFYHFIPFFIIGILLTAFLATGLQLLLSQLYPFFLSVATVFGAVSVAGHEEQEMTDVELEAEENNVQT